MVLVTCPCLNIRLRITHADLASAPHADLTSVSGDARNDRFLVTAKSVRLSPGGLHQEHETFVHKRTVGGWLVYTCTLCDMAVYAVQTSHSDGDSILVNCDLICDTTAIDRLHKSSNYSPAFRVLLNEATSTPSVQPNCSLDFLPYIQQEVTSYVMAEEMAMEDRIRKFEQEERTKFVELQIRLKSDKKKLISLVLQNSKDNLNTLSPSKKSLSHSVSSPIHMDGLNGNHGSHKNVTNNKAPASQADLLLDNDDELFHMDGNEDGNEMSEDDGLDTDDSSAIERSSSPGLFSTSYPVNVPVWRSKNSPPILPEDVADGNQGAPDIDQIHANIQALAKSVHDSSKEIFGDLPRPRLNTYSGRQTHR